jgi:hypothetical protein
VPGTPLTLVRTQYVEEGVTSSMGRELQALSSHTIRHLALIPSYIRQQQDAA